MVRFKKVLAPHQVDFDEYLASLDDLFPDGVPVPAPLPYSAPWRVRNAPIFPGAVDGVGAAPAAPDPPQVVYSRFRRRLG